MKKILKDKKGFTLMEVIVVLIIIAVLAAALIPSFIGFVNQSRASEDIAAARVGMAAGQVEVTYVWADTGAAPDSETIVGSQRFIDSVAPDTEGAEYFSGFEVSDKGQVTGLTYEGKLYIITISEANGVVYVQK